MKSQLFNKEHGKLSADDKAEINNTINKFKDHKSKYGITDVLAPDDNIATRKKLQSKDGTTWVMQLNIAKSHGRIADVESEIIKQRKLVASRLTLLVLIFWKMPFLNQFKKVSKRLKLLPLSLFLSY